MNGIPSTWNYSSGQVGAGNVPQVLAPATPGVTHVITQMSGVVLSQGGAYGPVTFYLNGYTPPGVLYVPATANQQSSYTWTGVVIGELGAQVLAYIAGTLPAQVVGIIEIQGYSF